MEMRLRETLVPQGRVTGALSQRYQHLPSALGFIKSASVLSGSRGYLVIIQVICPPFAPVFGTSGTPGRDVPPDDCELKAARVKSGFSAIPEGPVLGHFFM